MKFNMKLLALLTLMNPIVPYSDSEDEIMEEAGEAVPGGTVEASNPPHHKRRIQHVAVLHQPNLAFSLGFPDNVWKTRIRDAERELDSRYEPVPKERIILMKSMEKRYEAVIQPGTGHATLNVGNKRYRFTNNAYVEMLHDEESRIISELNSLHEQDVLFVAEANRLQTLMLCKSPSHDPSLQTHTIKFKTQIEYICMVRADIMKNMSNLRDIQEKYQKSEEIMKKESELNFIFCFDDHFLFSVNDKRRNNSLYGNQYYSDEESKRTYAIKLFEVNRSRKEALYLSDVDLLEDCMISCIINNHEKMNKVVKQPRRFFSEYFEDLDPSVVRDYPECFSEPDSGYGSDTQSSSAKSSAESSDGEMEEVGPGNQ